MANTSYSLKRYAPKMWEIEVRLADGCSLGVYAHCETRREAIATAYRALKGTTGHVIRCVGEADMNKMQLAQARYALFGEEPSILPSRSDPSMRHCF